MSVLFCRDHWDRARPSLRGPLLSIVSDDWLVTAVTIRWAIMTDEDRAACWDELERRHPDLGVEELRKTVLFADEHVGAPRPVYGEEEVNPIVEALRAAKASVLESDKRKRRWWVR